MGRFCLYPCPKTFWMRGTGPVCDDPWFPVSLSIHSLSKTALRTIASVLSGISETSAELPSPSRNWDLSFRPSPPTLQTHFTDWLAHFSFLSKIKMFPRCANGGRKGWGERRGMFGMNEERRGERNSYRLISFPCLGTFALFYFILIFFLVDVSHH